LARHGGQLHCAAHPQWRAPRAIAAAAVDAPAALLSRRLSSRLSAPWLVTVGSCLVLLKLSGLLLAIAVAAVEAPAASAACPLPSAPPLSMLQPLCVSRFVFSGLSSWRSRGGQLRHAAHPERRGPHSIARLGGKPIVLLILGDVPLASPLPLPLSRLQLLFVPRCLSSRLSTPWLITGGSCIALLTLGGMLIAIAAATVDAPAAVSVALCVFSRLSAPWLVTVGSCIMLLNLSGLLIAIVVAAVEAPAALCAGLPLHSRLFVPCAVTVGSCIVLLNLSGLLIAIASAAVEELATPCVALPIWPPLRPLGRRGGQLHRAVHPQRRAHRHRRRRFRCSGRCARRAASSAASPLLG